MKELEYYVIAAIGENKESFSTVSVEMPLIEAIKVRNKYFSEGFEAYVVVAV